jgi:hypothetical protein
MAGIKPNNVIRVPCTLNSLFRYWLDFLSPFHNLTDRETDVAAAFLRERYRLSKVILDSDLVDRTLMSEESQRKLRQECELTNQHFQVIKSKLKNKKFFVNDKINPRLVPNINDMIKSFQLLLVFDFTNDV